MNMWESDNSDSNLSVCGGAQVRTVSAYAVKEVLSEETFEHIKLVVFAMPIFRPKDNFEYFARAFKPETYAGATPVMVVDNDMHAIALAVGRLRPVDCVSVLVYVAHSHELAWVCQLSWA